MNGKPKLSLLAGRRESQRQQDMRDILKHTSSLVEEGHVERLLIIVDRDDRPPEMFCANFDTIPVLGILSWIVGLVRGMEMHDMPEEPAPEDGPSDDAPPEG